MMRRPWNATPNWQVWVSTGATHTCQLAGSGGFGG
jgi:hypothetical protein